jgi:hypothetical protein
MCPFQVPNGCAAQVVDEHAHLASTLATTAPGFAVLPDWLSISVKLS